MNPREVYDDEVLEALYEDVRQWPEVEDLDAYDPDHPVITLRAVHKKPGMYRPASEVEIYPPSRYEVDYTEPELGRHHYSHRVLSLEKWTPRTITIRSMTLEGAPLGALCVESFKWDNQNPFVVFAQIRDYHYGMLGDFFVEHSYIARAVNKYWAAHKKGVVVEWEDGKTVVR